MIKINLTKPKIKKSKRLLDKILEAVGKLDNPKVDKWVVKQEDAIQEFFYKDIIESSIEYLRDCVLNLGHYFTKLHKNRNRHHKL